MKKMTPQELIDLIAGTAKKGARPATVTLSTTPNMRKFHRTEKNKDGSKIENPYLNVIKIATYKVMLNFNFENAVNNQKKREGQKADFKASERTWGEHITRSLIVKDGQHYLQCKREKTLDVAFVLDGEIIEQSLLEEYLVVSKSSTNQGLKKTVKPFSPKIENVMSINIDNQQIVQ